MAPERPYISPLTQHRERLFIASQNKGWKQGFSKDSLSQPPGFIPTHTPSHYRAAGKKHIVFLIKQWLPPAQNIRPGTEGFTDHGKVVMLTIDRNRTRREPGKTLEWIFRFDFEASHFHESISVSSPWNIKPGQETSSSWSKRRMISLRPRHNELLWTPVLVG